MNTVLEWQQWTEINIFAKRAPNVDHWFAKESSRYMRDCTLLVQFILVSSSDNQVTEWEEIINIYIDQAKNYFTCITPEQVCE